MHPNIALNGLRQYISVTQFAIANLKWSKI